MQHRTQSDLENATMADTGRAFQTPQGYLMGWGATAGTVNGVALENWAPGAIWHDTDSGTSSTNTGTATTASWTSNT